MFYIIKEPVLEYAFWFIYTNSLVRRHAVLIGKDKDSRTYAVNCRTREVEILPDL